MINSVKQLVLQPTSFCNLDCSYCYLPDRQKKQFMTVETAMLIFSKLLHSELADREMEIRWHAGEPLFAGLDFYRSVMRNLKEITPSDYLFRHTIQTNGTVLNDEWCEFFKNEGFEVGLSIDGPANLHNLRRRTRSDVETHSAVVRAAQLLRKHNLPFSVIAVLTDESLNRVEDIYEFFSEIHPTHVGFNIEEIEGANQFSSLDYSGVKLRFRDFLKKFSELALDGQVSCREFEGMRNTILSKETKVQNWMNMPGRILCVAWNGEVTGFSPEFQGQNHPMYGDFSFGNIQNDSLNSLFESKNFQKLCKDIENGVRACEDACQYFSICGGGAPSNKLFENGSIETTETTYCMFRYQAVADIVLENIEKSLKAVV
ncbi:arylsulfatase regulator (Fe-S oxidoreductase) [Xenococcus sp. PCC 7305]|uniref:cyclophane-forming radical SAM/SPASM peptide maturase GrrM/OscB n=1 Tax=Xenococcus sp. PCC 7305 TaxID=102125 RepID=UPI0002ABD199|nr:cyclophane-forming radical SAM/SPASM peptide maturase GrrM/OscB [Xenococcus sp. PCC 7305]ELS04296.1 arylsulfatase regulator (Fe-S oxidoreductase) [Xenococcus sp. PCC 7305]